MKITFDDKEQLITNPNIPRKNKVVADDINEIKRAINDNDDNITELDTRKADKTEIPTNLNQLSNADTKFVNETQMANAVQQETTARQQQDVELQNQIDAITSQSDVVDVVGTYAELLSYDTSTITENDIIKVLQDSTHDNATSYFRWSNNSWAYVGSEGPYYTKGETDERLNQKANQTSLDTTNQNLNTLSGRVGTNETEITGIKAEQTTQNRQIATLISDSGNKIELSVNSQTYILTATLKNKAGEILNSSQVDLPLEAMIVNATYDSTTKELVLTLQNGTTLRVSLADIVSGLVSQDDFDTLEVRVKNLEDDVADIKTEQDTQNAEIEELQEQVEILENTVNSELEDATATGESITVTDSANAPAKLLPSGRTEQQTYEGYNELETTMQYNNVTQANVKATTNPDGTITLNGTANSATEFKFMLTEDIITLLENENYMMTKKLISGTASEILIAYRLDGTTGTFTNETKNLGSSTSSRTIDNVRIYINSGVTFNNARIGISLYKSSTEKSYEPYVGGQASPNPDYPQQIHVVKGHNEFLVNNKNWFDIGTKNDYITTDTDGARIQSLSPSPNIDFTISDNKITFNSYNSSGWHWLSKVCRLKPNTDYYLSYNKNISSGIVAIFGYNNVEIGATGKRINYSNTSSFTFNSGNYKYIVLCLFPMGAGGEISNIMIELGTTATTYVPHEEETAEFTLEEGQNLYEKDYLADDGIHHLIGGKRLTGNETGWIIGASTIEGIKNFSLPIAGIKIANNGAGKSTHFINSNYNYTNGRVRFGWSDRNVYFYVSATDFPTLDSFKTFLVEKYNSETPVEIVYELQDELKEPYTELQQQQYNKLKKIMSYFAGTNINTISAGDLKPILNFDYKKSNRLRDDNQDKEIENIKARLDLLEG